MLYEVRWHGRGGQGVVTAALLFAEAALEEGLYALAIPFFGAERRGAPVVAFNRISNKVIRMRSAVTSPDAVAVLDPSLFSLLDVSSGLKADGLMLVNSPEPPPSLPENVKIACVNATEIALGENLVLAGYPLINMPMVGALSRVTGLVRLESLKKAVFKLWRGEIAEKNWRGVKRGYNEVKLCQK